MEVQERTFGVNLNEKGAAVKIWAPLAERVVLKLNGKELSLQKGGYGYWTVQSADIREGDRYKIVVDGKERPDPASLSQPEGVHGPSRVVDLKGFSWSDADWRNIALEQYIIYELHTGTFSPQGTFAGIVQQLDHLKELGVNAIELMPVAQFPGSRNWGYDGVYPFAVQDSYGGAEGLQQLVDECHRRGIALILDVVYNHMGPEGNYFGDFGPFFTDKYKTPWGPAINFDDAWCDGVREYFIENVLMWFRDFHIDALRLDAVHAIKDFSARHILREIREAVDALMQATGRTHYLIVELDLNDTRFINGTAEGGFGMDAQWVDEFHHALRVTAGEPKTGYYSDFEGIRHLAKSYSDAYVYDGQFSPHRQKKFGIPAEKNPGRQFIVFSQNHDQVGNRMMGERTGKLVSFEMQKLMAGAVLTSPFLPMLFMGEEWGESNPFLYFVSHTDPDLAEAVRKGRKAEFAAFHAEGEAPDPVSEETFHRSKLQWALKGSEPHATLFRYYRELIRLRQSVPPLCRLDRKAVHVEAKEREQTLMLHRWYDGHEVVAAMNFSARRQEARLPIHVPVWHRLFDSASPAWRGPGAATEIAGGGAPGANTISLQPESIVIYTNRP